MTNYEKYDRQIRLFGHETQEKLINTKITIISASTNFLAAEIYKNFLLLGCSEFIINDKVHDSVNQILFDSVAKISDAKIHIRDFSIDCDVYVSIGGSSYYICASCLTFSRVSHCCRVKENEIHLQMLLGSIFVQEIVKRTKGDNYIDEYKLQI